MAKSGVKERILLLIKELEIEKSVFQRNVGLSNGFVDKVTDNIRSSSIDAIVKTYPNVNRKWLKDGEGEMFINVGFKGKIDGIVNNILDEVHIIDTEEKYLIAMKAGLKMIPEVDFVFSAGSEVLLGNTDSITKYWHIPDCDDCEAIVPMKGNSMLPTYPPGCELVLKRYSFDPRKPNQIAFDNVFGIVVEDEITGEYHGHIKILRLHRDPEMAKKYWIARSLNIEEFDDFDIEISMVRGLWIVKKHAVTNILI